MVLLVRRAIFRSVCLKTLVMYEVSLPVYMKVTHFCLGLVSIVVVLYCWGCVSVVWMGTNCRVGCCE
jgi:hypothetical protein